MVYSSALEKRHASGHREFESHFLRSQKMAQILSHFLLQKVRFEPKSVFIKIYEIYSD